MKYKEILQKMYTEYQDDIESIILGGSNVVPYIDAIGDIDVFVVLKDGSKVNEMRLKLLPYQRQLHEYLVALLIRDPNLHKWYADESYNGNIYGGGWQQGYPLHIYQAKYNKVLFGTDSAHLNEISIFDQLDRLIPTIKESIDAAEGKKWFYHILIDLYILQNNSYELTEEQMNNVNIVHDQEDKEAIASLYAWAKEQVNNL